MLDHVIGAVAGLGGLLLLAACGQVPQPFSKDEANLAKAPFLIAPTTEGVVVLPVEGVPADTGQLIADLAAEALQKQDVAANVRISNRASLFLSGAGRRLPDGRMEIAWTLARPDGTVIGERTDIVASDAQLSESTAKVAAWLRPQKPDVVVIVPKVTVYPVDGAPGDGNDLLRRALELALDRAPVQLTTDVAENGHVVQGDVSITRLNTGNDRVVISWIVLDAHGKQIGVVDQDNVVPGGSLDRSWGAVAAPIADAALGGIVALLKESEAARAAVGIGPATLTN
jgi:hypothetical protein